MSDGTEDRPEPTKPEPTPPPLITPLVFLGIVATLLVLLVAVIVNGIARNDLDSTAVAGVLSTLFSGIVAGVVWRGGRGGPTG